MKGTQTLPIDLRLARHGAILLLLAMLTGFVITRSHNPAEGNAAHLTGLLGGYGLIALGLLWPKVNLGRFLSGAGAWVTAASLYLNWLVLVLPALFGSGPNAASAPHLGPVAMWNRASGVILILAVVFSLASALVVLAGLRSPTARAIQRATVPATD